MPTVSILIPTYNRERYISQCLDSALAQEFDDFEVVVVDNASEDATFEISEKYSKRDSRVRVYQNSINVGPVRNWARCIELAHGEFGKLLFSDDMIMPEFLSETVSLMSEPEIAFVSTAALIGTTPGSSKLSYQHGSGVHVLSSEQYLRRLARGIPAVPVSPGAALFRLKDLKQNLMLDVPSPVPHDFSANGAGPDVLLFALTACKYRKVAIVNKPLAFFRKHEGSFTIANRENAVSEGYSRALSWFFREYSLPFNWATWVARIWLRVVWRDKRWISPRSIASHYAGNGSLHDLVRLLAASSGIIWRWVLGAPTNFGRTLRLTK